MTLNQVVNLGVAVGQNLPYNHVVQAWNGQTGASLPTFPQAVEDFQLLSSPMVADVSDALGNEVLVGTGLYYLRNFNVAGIEGDRAGRSSPAAGSSRRPRSATRTATATSRSRRSRARASRSVWDTPASLRHQRRVVDVPPRRVEHRRLRHRHPPTRDAHAARRQPNGSQRALTWTAPGDDWLCGTRVEYPSCAPPVRSSIPATARSWATSPPVRPGPRRAGRSPLDRGTSTGRLLPDERGQLGRARKTSVPTRAGASPFRVSLVPATTSARRQPHARARRSTSLPATRRPAPRPHGRDPRLQRAAAAVGVPDWA